MKITEKELEDFLFKKLNEKKFDYLKSIGFHVNTLKNYYYYRQVSLGTHGRLDILGLNISPDKDLYNRNMASYMIIELKEGPVCEKTFIQALRYMGALDSALTFYNKIYQIVLIGSSVDPSLEDAINLTGMNVSIFTYDLGLDGIRFRCNSILTPKGAMIDHSYEGDKIHQLIEENLKLSEHESNFTNTEF